MKINPNPSTNSSTRTSISSAILNNQFVEALCHRLEFSRRPSLFGNDQKHCLCTVLKPFISLAQIFGIFPLSHDAEACKLNHCWFSVPSCINYIWIISFTILSTCVLNRVSSILKLIATGTDFYTILAMLVISTAASILIYIIGSFSAMNLSKGWDRLHVTVEELSFPSYKLVKGTVYLIPILVVEEFIIDMSMISFGYMNDELKIDNMYFLIGAESFIINFVPNILCGSFIVLMWIIAIHFNAINDQLEAVLKESCNYLSVDVIDSSLGGERLIDQRKTDGGGGGKNGDFRLVSKISRLNVRHENLCETTRLVQNSFGIQVRLLAVFCATGISFVGGIYSFIIISNGLMVSNKLSNLSYAFSISSILSGFRLLVVLVICQYVMNKSNKTGSILSGYNGDYRSNEMKRQVDEFKQKVGLFPLNITCCNIFPLSTSVFAAAAGNIVTYVLVLMQFKLNSKPFPDDDETTTTEGGRRFTDDVMSFYNNTSTINSSIGE